MILDDKLAKIIRPIVEGQIRSFIHSHPNIITGVDWRYSQATPAEALVASIAKRISRELLSDQTRVRLSAAMGSGTSDGQPVAECLTATEGVELEPAPTDAGLQVGSGPLSE